MNTALGRASVEVGGRRDEVSKSHVLWSVGEEVLNPTTEVVVQAQWKQLVDQLVWVDGIKGRAEINKHHLHIGVGVPRVCEGSVEQECDGVLGTYVDFIGKLVLVQVARDGGVDVFHYQSLKAFHDYRCKCDNHISA